MHVVQGEHKTRRNVYCLVAKENNCSAKKHDFVAKKTTQSKTHITKTN
jgi:hypothetical protein